MIYGLIANPRKDLFWQELPEMLDWFAAERIELLILEDLGEHDNFPDRRGKFNVVSVDEMLSSTDMILAFGGDGTILRAVQRIAAREIPVLGINVGGLGFLTEIPLEDFRPAFKKIVANEYRIEQRTILQTDIAGENTPMYSLNELLIDKGGFVRVIEIEAMVDQALLNTYIADGLIISTATGSTGYSMSSGGPIVLPTADVVIINPICPHSLTARPIVIPADHQIQLTVRTEYTKFMIAADGQDVRFAQSRTRLDVRKADFSARLVKPLEGDFYQLLRNKLNWGEDFRDKKRWSYNS